MKQEHQPLPPAIVLGGQANALSVARSLGRLGVRVYSLNDTDAPVRYSRWCRRLPVPWRGSDEASWAAWLLGSEADCLRGAVLLAASDQGIDVLARHRAALAERFRLDESNPEAQLAMLDKLATYRIAKAAGIPTPRFQVVSGPSVPDLDPETALPLLVKPLVSHRFAALFGGRKFLVARHRDELRRHLAATTAAGIEVMLVEMIPGPDDRLCSYYTYLDGSGAALFDFTKRVVRRFPVGMGNGCSHVTDRVPEVRELSLRLFRQAGLRGLANAEFKRDERDGKLKLIECNARFTAADCLLARSGLDVPAFVYGRLTGRPRPLPVGFALGVRLWYPGQDFRAFLELRRRGELTLGGWLRSIAHRQTLPLFRWDDPLPSAVALLRALKVDVAYCRARRWLRAVLDATRKRCQVLKGCLQECRAARPE
jgi:D-aspartate ligase